MDTAIVCVRCGTEDVELDGGDPTCWPCADAMAGDEGRHASHLHGLLWRVYNSPTVSRGSRITTKQTPTYLLNEVAEAIGHNGGRPNE